MAPSNKLAPVLSRKENFLEGVLFLLMFSGWLWNRLSHNLLIS